ncbi:hypothetical protein [Bradyrhizobium forestalis]|uniref:hypothetical protein n=1 Tax=Bradyrhizobium forestalis TaxID=1419263 RepID=UPI001303F9F2|nr:hypothetical protein [Bradyrhizobium forestalis]
MYKMTSRIKAHSIARTLVAVIPALLLVLTGSSGWLAVFARARNIAADVQFAA